MLYNLHLRAQGTSDTSQINLYKILSLLKSDVEIFEKIQGIIKAVPMGIGRNAFFGTIFTWPHIQWKQDPMDTSACRLFEKLQNSSRK